jgi:hypothetical protein
MWCPAPLPEGEVHRRKLRSDKYKPPVGRLLEFYESDSSVEADENTDVEDGDDAGVGPDASGAAKPRRRTRSAVGKQSASATAAAVSAVKAPEKKKRKAASPPAIVHRRFRHPNQGRSNCKKRRRRRRRRRRRTKLSRNCRSPRIDLRGGQRVLLPRGNGSWWRRRRRMPSAGVWRRSGLLLPLRQRCLRRLSLGFLG